MVTRITASWGKLRRAFSRNEWIVRWLKLPRRPVTDRPGLILIQVDGLSHDELKRALQEKRMPYLNSLLRREHYRLHSMYSGVPSTTPAVQAELFYGQRCAVPAFAFKDHQTGEFVRMVYPTAAHQVQQRLESQDAGLLADGSAYCDIYDGGAPESHFCAASIGWGNLIAEINPIRLSIALIAYSGSLFRALGLAIIELAIATGSFLQRDTSRSEFWQEVAMIRARVVVSILMRDLCIVGASIDATRGLPIIQVNLLGYDEHAHRRGPGSEFAHWTLKGIDRAIRRLAVAAHRSTRRHYDVWIYSDHGQESSMPYQYISGETIQRACSTAYREVVSKDADGSQISFEEQDASSRQSTVARANWLSARAWVVRLTGNVGSDPEPTGDVVTAALGPIAHVYIGDHATGSDPTIKSRLAKQLIQFHQVPMVGYLDDQKRTHVATDKGVFILPRERDCVFGASHPFCEQVAEDFSTLCRHASAGDLVLGGWLPDREPISFVLEHGAHCGVGPNETHAFALLPSDAPMMTSNRVLRPERLRMVAKRFLGDVPVPSSPQVGGSKVKLLTYNVHSCVGMDGKLSPSRIARVIARTDADVIALQEVDVRRMRSGNVDQAHQIAKHLTMDHHFHPAWEVEEERYGIALLSRLPMRLVKSGELPFAKDRRERRCAIWIELEDTRGNLIQIINTHLSLYSGERLAQAKSLAGDAWVGEALKRGPTILCGDLNANPRSPTYKVLSSILSDLHETAKGRTLATWLSPRPIARIDHAFGSPGVFVHAAKVIDSSLAQVASDHLPLLVEFECGMGPINATPDSTVTVASN